MEIDQRAEPAPDERAVVGSRTIDIVVGLLLLAFAGLMGWDNWRLGAGWASDGPQAGYFPFYLSLILAGASLFGLANALRRRGPGDAFVTRDRFRRVLQVLVPAIAFVAFVQVLGLYVASFILVAGFMRFVGRIALWKSLVTALVFVAAMFWIFDVAFNVIMPKGPLEAALGR